MQAQRTTATEKTTTRQRGPCAKQLNTLWIMVANGFRQCLQQRPIHAARCLQQNKQAHTQANATMPCRTCPGNKWISACEPIVAFAALHKTVGQLLDPTDGLCTLSRCLRTKPIKRNSRQRRPSARAHTCVGCLSAIHSSAACKSTSREEESTKRSAPSKAALT